MEKKATIFSLIFVSTIVLSSVALIIFLGITAREYNYVLLEINPRVEFIVDKDFRVVSYAPINDEARVILAGENLKGMDIDDACVKFIDVCAKTGYIDVEGEDNAINLTIIDGPTQALDTHICEGVYGYLKDNEIMGVLMENQNDRHSFEEKKKNHLCCSNKYKLISTICEKDERQDFDELKKLSEIELIDIVTNIHSTKHFKVTNEDIENKNNLLEKNLDKYESHMASINKNTQKKFAEDFEKFQKKNIDKYQSDYRERYDNWQKAVSL